MAMMMMMRKHQQGPSILLSGLLSVAASVSAEVCRRHCLHVEVPAELHARQQSPLPLPLQGQGQGQAGQAKRLWQRGRRGNEPVHQKLGSRVQLSTAAVAPSLASPPAAAATAAGTASSCEVAVLL